MSNFFIVAREVHDEHEIRPDDPAHAMHMMSRACDTTLQTHGRMWRRLERRAALTYEAQTGIKVTSTFDWASIKQWLKDHWPQIVSMLCSIISVFILLGAKKAVGGPLGIPELVHELTNETQKVELLTDQVAQMVPAVNTLLQRGNDQAEIITNTIAQMRGDGLTLTTTIQSPWGPMTVVNNLKVGGGAKPAFIRIVDKVEKVEEPVGRDRTGLYGNEETAGNVDEAIAMRAKHGANTKIVCEACHRFGVKVVFDHLEEFGKHRDDQHTTVHYDRNNFNLTGRINPNMAGERARDYNILSGMPRSMAERQAQLPEMSVEEAAQARRGKMAVKNLDLVTQAEIDKEALKAVDEFSKEQLAEGRRRSHAACASIYGGLHGTKEQRERAVVAINKYITYLCREEKLDLTKAPPLTTTASSKILCIVQGVPICEEDFQGSVPKDVREIIRDRVIRRCTVAT